MSTYRDVHTGVLRSAATGMEIRALTDQEWLECCEETMLFWANGGNPSNPFHTKERCEEMTQYWSRLFKDESDRQAKRGRYASL